MTHTYAILEVSPEAYAEIRAKLEAAGYSDQFVGQEIDMHGIAIAPASGGSGTGRPLSTDPYAAMGLTPVQSQAEEPPYLSCRACGRLGVRPGDVCMGCGKVTWP